MPDRQIAASGMAPKINITVVAHNRLELTKICLSSLLALTKGDYTVHVVDNGSSDGTWAYLSQLAANDSRVRPFRFGRNMGIAAAANYGWSQDEDAYYVKLDNDIRILDGAWLAILLAYLSQHEEIGVIGYKFLAKHRVCELTLADGAKFWDFETCGGACAMIPPHVHAMLGFWNEDYGKYGFEDMDYSLRCRLAGLKTGYAPHEDKAAHLGYDEPLQEYELKKLNQIENALVGEKMYFLNKVMFEEGIRPLKTLRRLLPIPGSDPIRFTSNPAYAGILRIQNELQKRTGFGKIADKVVLDFSNWKTDRCE